MFTKLDMIDNQPVLTKYIECRHDGVISDVTADQFRLEFYIFWACEHNNLIGLHPMFNKRDIVNNQPILTIFIDLRHDDVTVSAII